MINSKIKAVGANLLVKVDHAYEDELKVGTIVIPETSKDIPSTYESGYIVNMGNAVMEWAISDGAENEIKIGSRVFFKKYSGIDVSDKKQYALSMYSNKKIQDEYRIISDADILGFETTEE